MIIPNINGKIENVPNHQPGTIVNMGKRIVNHPRLGMGKMPPNVDDWGMVQMVLFYPYLLFPSNRGTLSSHPFLDGIFREINQPLG